MGHFLRDHFIIRRKIMRHLRIADTMRGRNCVGEYFEVRRIEVLVTAGINHKHRRANSR